MRLHILATLATLSAAVPYAITNPSKTLALIPRSPLETAPSPCTTPGQLLCHGLKMFGLCTEAHTITWMAVSDGTSCVCGSHDACAIFAADDSTSGPVPALTTSTPTYATISAPTSSTTSSTFSPGASSTPGTGSKYTQFNGNGSPQDGWPAMNDWLSFEDLFEANQPIGGTCETAFGVANNQASDNAALHDALLDQAKAAGVPPEFALAITLQESLGCVFVDTTFGSVSNPGLMQDHDGSASCSGQATCPEASIQSMLKQGLSGTSSGDGLKQCHAQAPSSNAAQAWYQAARIYNSGSLGPGGDLGADSAGTSCYASDIAHRLIGWSKGPSGCTTAD